VRAESESGFPGYLWEWSGGETSDVEGDEAGEDE
jgi:hypothetical protein